MVLGSVGFKSTGITGKLRLLVYKGLKMSGGNIQICLPGRSALKTCSQDGHRRSLFNALLQKGDIPQVECIGIIVSLG